MYKRQDKGRKKVKPHDPEHRVDSDATARIPGTLRGKLLGAEAEAEIARQDDEERAKHTTTSTSSSSSSWENHAAGTGSGERSMEDGPSVGPEPNTVSTGTDPAELPPEGEQSLPRTVRGPDREQRVRRTWTDTAVGAPNPNQWIDFDVGKSVRLLRTDREDAIRLVLRKLHIRWWHASELTMKRFLDRVGVSQICLLYTSPSPRD